MSLTSYKVINAGGVSKRPQPTMLGHYSHLSQGPDVDDAVVFNKPIDPDVTPQKCRLHFMPYGRVFSLNTKGAMVPGVWDTDQIPVAALLIGSHADDGDVTGGPRIGDPRYDRDAQVPIKDEANAPFWSLDAGYIFETSEFDSADSVALVPTTPVTAVPDMNDFDIAGTIKPGTVYVDHIIGTVYEGAAPCGINRAINTIKILGGVVPRIPKGTLDLLRS